MGIRLIDIYATHKKASEIASLVRSRAHHNLNSSGETLKWNTHEE